MRAQKRLLLIDRAACCCSAKNVLLIFCFHQIFHLKYESGNEAVSSIHKESQSCCFAFGSAALGGGTGAGRHPCGSCRDHSLDFHPEPHPRLWQPRQRKDGAENCQANLLSFEESKACSWWPCKY